MMRVDRGPLLALAGLLLFVLAGCSTKPEVSKPISGTGAKLTPSELARKGDFIGARSALEGMASRDFESELLLTSVALRLNDCGTAVSAALRAKSLAGADTDRLYRSDLALGEAFLADDKPENALVEFSSARKLAPSMHERDRAIVCCARAELARGGVAAARRLRDEILRADIPELADLDRRLLKAGAPAPRSNGTGSVSVASGSVRIGRRPQGKGIAPPPIVARATWGAKPIKLRNEPDPIGRIERITVHHTADPNGVPGASLIENVARVKAYQAAHQDDKRWADIGYHFVIDRQGRIFEGRELCWQGAHAGNEKANLHNVGIAVMGNFDRIKLTDAQQGSLEKLMLWLVAEYSLTRAAVAGHDDVRRSSTGSGTKCPGKNLDAFLEKWKRAH